MPSDTCVPILSMSVLKKAILYSRGSGLLIIQELYRRWQKAFAKNNTHLIHINIRNYKYARWTMAMIKEAFFKVFVTN